MIFLFWVCVASTESGAYFATFVKFELLPPQITFKEPSSLKALPFHLGFT